MESLEQFLAAVSASRKVWLLQAMEGMFAMLEDGDGNSYIPVWESRDKAEMAAQGDWKGYAVSEMEFWELAGWLRELAEDEIDLAVSPEKEGPITAIASANFRKWVMPFIKEEDKRKLKASESDDDDDAVDDKDGWAAPWDETNL